MATEDYSDYQHGDLIEGSPAELSQHISAIFVSGAHFQYVDGNVIEVIRPGKDEAIVFSNGAVQFPVSQPQPEPAPVEKAEELSPAEDLAAIEEAVIAPAPAPAAPVKRGRKPKAVVAEEAPAEDPTTPVEVEEV